MRNIVGKHSIWRQDQNIGRLQILSVMVEKIGDPVKRHGSFPASCRTLDHHDFIFGISNARDNANNMKNAGAWTYALKRRKEASKAFVGGGAPLSPISTLVVTEQEVESVKAACGIDISKEDVAAKLIRDYFLLAFMIYNTQTKAVMTMIDSDKNRGFATTNINGLKAGNKKDTGLDAKDLIKLLGR